MNKVKTFFLGMAMLAVLVSSCKKKDKKSEDPQPDLKKEASITIYSPTTGQQFDHGATVTISGKIESDEQLHGYKLIIRQKSDNSEKYVENAHTHSKTIEFSETWDVDVEGHQDMELEVIGILDHDGNTITKKIDFHCHGH
jgi:hypothetical protein